MEFLAAIALAALTGWIIANSHLLLSDETVGAFSRLVGGWRGDGWPRGVQEEDRDRPWGHGPSRDPTTATDADDEPYPLPTLTPLRPHIRGR